MAISGDVFRINQVYELLQEGQWPLDFIFLENTHGWFAGGRFSSDQSTIERINFSQDTSTASLRGPLTLSRYALVGSSNFNYGWFGGGNTFDNGVVRSRVDRIQFSSDTGTSSTRGPLSISRFFPGASGDSNYGWFAGGITTVAISTIDRINYSTDTSTATVRNNLSLSRWGLKSIDNDSYGWFAGGVNPYTNRVDRLDFQNDTSSISIRGSLLYTVRDFGTAGNLNYGWIAGGNDFPGNISRVQRITYSTDTSTVSLRGPLSSAKGYFSGTTNNSFGWFDGSNSTTNMDRIEFSTDTSTAILRGNLAFPRYSTASASGMI